jgi:hypothetical protein
MSTKDVQSGLVSNMRKWQKIEDASVSSTGQMIEKTENPLLRLVMEIMRIHFSASLWRSYNATRRCITVYRSSSQIVLSTRQYL